MTYNLRILSLLPAATEIVYLLGLEKYLVGVSHECDYPKEAKLLPEVTSSPISNDLSSFQINKQISKLQHKGSGVFHIDQKLLAELKPNLILTQELCDVCAISWTQVKKAARVLESRSKNHESRVNIVSLEPESIGDILDNILLVGETGGKYQEAGRIVLDLKKRIENCKLKIENSTKPKVCVVEWLDPIMIAGHWVPEMIEKAGGKGVITKSGQKSIPISKEELARLTPDIIIFAPCGFDLKRTLREKNLVEDLKSIIKKSDAKYYLMDGNAYLTRPGPRITDGVEILAEILHPGIFPKKHKNSDWKIL